jgi:diaminohydroxyphosphoribosylaminopyrimidine deaminase/5-amino-6-(5-phosphoribosylamino)uracil reductase
LDNKGLFDLKKVLSKLFNLGVRNLLIEGGDKITKNLIKNKLIDIFYLFESSKVLTKGKIIQFFTSYKILGKKYKKKYRFASNLAKDKITIYKR